LRQKGGNALLSIGRRGRARRASAASDHFAATRPVFLRPPARASSGPALGRHWTGTGSALNRHWVGTGPALNRHRAGT